MNGVDVARAVGSLRPDGRWTYWLCGLEAERAVAKWRSFGAPSRWLTDDERRLSFLHGGRVLRGWRNPSGALGLRLSRHGLDVAACVGPALLRTAGASAVVSSSLELPMILQAAMVGRPIENLFDHPAIRGRGYLVTGQTHEPSRPSDWALEFHTGFVGWRVPWARRRDGLGG